MPNSLNLTKLHILRLQLLQQVREAKLQSKWGGGGGGGEGAKWEGRIESKQAKKDLLKPVRRGTKCALLKLPQRYCGQSSLVCFPYASVSRAVFSSVSLLVFLAHSSLILSNMYVPTPLAYLTFLSCLVDLNSALRKNFGFWLLHICGIPRGEIRFFFY